MYCTVPYNFKCSTVSSAGQHKAHYSIRHGSVSSMVQYQVQYSTVPSAVQYSTKCSTVQYSTKCNTLQYSTVLQYQVQVQYCITKCKYSTAVPRARPAPSTVQYQEQGQHQVQYSTKCSTVQYQVQYSTVPSAVQYQVQYSITVPNAVQYSAKCRTVQYQVQYSAKCSTAQFQVQYSTLPRTVRYQVQYSRVLSSVQPSSECSTNSIVLSGVEKY